MDRYWLARVTTRALSVIAGGALMCLPLDASAENHRMRATRSPNRRRCRINCPRGRNS